MLGTSGSSEERSDPVTARARILPPCTGSNPPKTRSADLRRALANCPCHRYFLGDAPPNSVEFRDAYCIDIAHGGNPLSGGEKIPDQLVRFNLSLVDNRHRVEPDLEEEELAAIGYVTAQWAHLEHGILASTLVLSYENEAAPPKETTSRAFEKRLGAWRVTIERFVTDKKEKARLLKLVSKAANLSASRHKLAHGLWTWDYTDPKTLRAS